MNFSVNAFEIQYSLSVKMPHTNNIIILIITLDSFLYSHFYLGWVLWQNCCCQIPILSTLHCMKKNNLSFYLGTWWLGIKIIFTDSLCTPSTFKGMHADVLYGTFRIYLSKVLVSPAFSSPSSLMAQCRCNWISATNMDHEWRREG